MDHIDNALENFCDRHWPCEYINSAGGRCVNVRSGHSKGHQSEYGKVFAAGDYQSTFSFEKYHQTFEAEVYFHLDELWKELREKSNNGRTEEANAASLHKEKILPHFFKHATGGGALDRIVSHKVCFCCLFEMANHCLPCGHVLCTA